MAIRCRILQLWCDGSVDWTVVSSGCRATSCSTSSESLQPAINQSMLRTIATHASSAIVHASCSFCSQRRRLLMLTFDMHIDFSWHGRDTSCMHGDFQRTPAKQNLRLNFHTPWLTGYQEKIGIELLLELFFVGAKGWLRLILRGSRQDFSSLAFYDVLIARWASHSLLTLLTFADDGWNIGLRQW